MTNETIFFTKVASIIAFITALFVLYRILVNQKDATIELLKEKNSFLNEQLAIAKKEAPDQLAKVLSERIKILHEEISRLSEDQEMNKLLIDKKENDLQNLNRQLEEIQEIASEYFCPFCKAPMVAKEYHTEFREHYEIDHEYIAFDCGFSIQDGKEDGKCKNKQLDNNRLHSEAEKARLR